MSTTTVGVRPARWSAGERRRRAFMKRFSRMTALQRLRFLCNVNPYQDYGGFIYAFTQRVYNRSGVYIGTRVKYGLTNNIDRRRREYRDCGRMRWISYWATDCVKLTANLALEAMIHARLRVRGINIKKVDCVCGGHHREFFWKAGIGRTVDIKRVVEQTLIATAQRIDRHIPAVKSHTGCVRLNQVVARVLSLAPYPFGSYHNFIRDTIEM
ncbi:hypothetical protein R3P38DRAFT_2792421 [Favolaschia claudopus]|uniref:Bacteriophage T5 Orf172 DNA-binding domain-containing protein n=1 Tax=Favolaschia claudopus TaxID=2862362 RepID=A0AAW0AG71_9AGAR